MFEQLAAQTIGSWPKSENSTVFNDATLASSDVVVMLQTSGMVWDNDVLHAEQQFPWWARGPEHQHLRVLGSSYSTDGVAFTQFGPGLTLNNKLDVLHGLPVRRVQLRHPVARRRGDVAAVRTRHPIAPNPEVPHVHVQPPHHVRPGDREQFAPKLRSAGGNFDPNEWAQLFADAGARFAGPVAEHHDGYSMWNSAANEWNSVRTGPRLDLVRLHADAIRAKGMQFLVSLHHAYNFTGSTRARTG